MRTALLLVFFTAAVTGALAAGDTGSLALICPEGFAVSIDGVRYGETTAAEQGLIVEALAVGRHRLQVFREGYAEQDPEFVVQKNKTTVIRVSPQAASYQVRKQQEQTVQVEEQVGSLSVRSLPPEAVFLIDGKRIGTTDSDVDGFRAGEHQIEFRGADGKVLPSRFTLEAGDRLDILASFPRMEVRYTSELEAARVAAAEQRRMEEERQRVAAERQKAAEREKATAELAKSSRYRIVVRNVPSYGDFVEYVTRTRTAYAYVSPPGQKSNKELGGLGQILNFAGGFWKGVGTAATLRDAAAYERWVRAPRFGEPTWPGQTVDGPTPFPFPKLLGIGERSNGFWIHYRESFTVTYMFKKNSDGYKTNTEMLLDNRAVELRPGHTTIRVDVAIKGEQLELRVAEVEYENPLEGTTEKVAY